MVTYSVTIDKEANSDIFLKLMNELKFVVRVKSEIEFEMTHFIDLALPGEQAKDESLQSLVETTDKSGRITANESKKKNLQRFNAWHKNAIK